MTPENNTAAIPMSNLRMCHTLHPDSTPGFHVVDSALLPVSDLQLARRIIGNRRTAKISLEAIGCQKRSTLEKQNALEEGQKRGCCGSTELAIIVARRS